MKEKSTNEKVGIYIVIFLIVLLVVILVLYKLNILGRKPDEANLVIDDEVMFKYSKKKWSIVDQNLYENYNWNKYKVYSDNEYIGKKYVVNMIDKWYVFEKNRKSVTVPGDKLYLGGKINTDLGKFVKEDFVSSDMNYIHKILDNYKISRDDQNKYTYGYKVSFDFDNDGKDEELFVISNMFSDVEVKNSYSFMFIKDGSNTKIIYNKVYGSGNNLTGCYSYLYGIVKVDGTNNYQLITKCSHYSVSLENEYGLYQYKNNRVEMLIYSK